MNKAELVNNLHQLFDLSGKTAIVTGGAMGIGLGIAKRLAEAGANIVIADINEQAGNTAVAELQESGWKSIFVQADVSSAEDAQHAVNSAVDTYGSLDILVNNAGIYPQGSMLDMKLETFEKILAVNLKSAFLFTKISAEKMIAQGRGGRIINITSIDAIHPSSVGLSAYGASKHGLWGFTKNTALELAAYNIQVNAIAPGGISTPGAGAGQPGIEDIMKAFIAKIPLKRIGQPDDIGKVALFLASDLSSYMTGSQIVVDGGVLLS
ncbi:MAG TPA: SDR family oxidoreductase [Candidatus Andersenbacteria bacterium]|nr:SDR family oxidoreductase [Candidatus Andersenbacteria bacterium]